MDDDEVTGTELRNTVSLPGQGRRLQVLGTSQTWKIISHQTRGKLIFVEIDVPPGAGIPTHVHTGEDETFIVLTGSIRFAGDDVAGGSVVVGAGGVVYGPRGRRHSFSCEGEGSAKLLTVVSPGAPTEALFDEVRTLQDQQGSPADAAQIVDLCSRYGITFEAA